MLSKNKLLGYEITSELFAQKINGLKISILSPSSKKLDKLRKKYEINKFIPLERNEITSISGTVKTKSYDYGIKLGDFDLNKWNEDNSIENGSSISFLTEYKGSVILWLADAHPTDVVFSLKKMGYSIKNKLKCDFVKVTHHGSKGNNSNELYELIECGDYIYSVNGENTHYLPSKESISRIIRNKNRSMNSNYRFYFTYDNTTLRKIFEVDGPEVFEKWKFKVEYLSNSKFLKFTKKIN